MVNCLRLDELAVSMRTGPGQAREILLELVADGWAEPVGPDAWRPTARAVAELRPAFAAMTTETP